MMLDTNVVIDLREEDSRWFEWAEDAISQAIDELLSVSAIVVGELASRGGTQVEIVEMLTGFGVAIEPLSAAASYRAGLAHRAYREAGGRRESLLGDFLIGAHASVAGGALITRDPRPYRRYFPDLALITPEIGRS